MAAFAGVVYEKFKFVDRVVESTNKSAEDTAKINANAGGVRKMTKDVLLQLDSIKKAVALVDSLNQSKER